MDKYCALVGGKWAVADSMERLVERSNSGSSVSSAPIEIFEMKSLGRFRRKIEVEQVEEVKPPENETENDFDDET